MYINPPSLSPDSHPTVFVSKERKQQIGRTHSPPSRTDTITSHHQTITYLYRLWAMTQGQIKKKKSATAVGGAGSSSTTRRYVTL